MVLNKAIVCALTIVPLWAAQFSGVIVDEYSNPLVGARVVIANSNTEMLTNSLGEFSSDNITADLAVPNPVQFLNINQQLSIKLNSTSEVSLAIYDLKGNLSYSSDLKTYSPGLHNLTSFDNINEGTYFAKLIIDGQLSTHSFNVIGKEKNLLNKPMRLNSTALSSSDTLHIYADGYAPLHHQVVPQWSDYGNLALSPLFEKKLGFMIDSRDGQLYRTAEILDRIWFRDNLNYDPFPNTGETYSFCSVTDPQCKYGRIYNFWGIANIADTSFYVDPPTNEVKAMDFYLEPHDSSDGSYRKVSLQGSCPQGWTVLNQYNYQTLIYFSNDYYEENRGQINFLDFGFPEDKTDFEKFLLLSQNFEFGRDEFGFNLNTPTVYEKNNIIKSYINDDGSPASIMIKALSIDRYMSKTGLATIEFSTPVPENGFYGQWSYFYDQDEFGHYRCVKE